MTEQEQKAIEILDTFELRRKTKNYNKLDLNDVYASQIALNLISKLQEENKKLREGKDTAENELKSQLDENKKLQADINKKDKRLNRQFKLLSKKDKEIKELKQDNNHHWEERCKLTFKLEKKQSDIEIKDKVIDLMADKLSERSEWYTKERWKEICYKQVEKVEEEK